jgi:CheY-like chemotaxis protein
MMPAIQHHSVPRVLVIEDHPLLQKIHEYSLTKMGFEATIVGDAKNAMAHWEEPWDLIFSDIGLPDIQGTELCQKRRAFEKAHGIYTPAFAYSAFGSTIKDECLAAGFDQFGVKPMSNEQLYNALQALLPDFELIPLQSAN